MDSAVLNKRVPWSFPHQNTVGGTCSAAAPQAGLDRPEWPWSSGRGPVAVVQSVEGAVRSVSAPRVGVAVLAASVPRVREQRLWIPGTRLSWAGGQRGHDLLLSGPLRVATCALRS